jgi:galactose mutarotase-like enzyme
MSWSLDDRLTHSLDSRQFFDMRESTLPNGMRIIDAYNAAGLHFTLLPDRGMDIWTAHYKGMPLTWVAPGSPFPPDEAQDWRRQFNGGLLTTCGLVHVGPPEYDDQSGEYRDLHGRFTRLRATNTGVAAEPERIDRYGELSETRLFAEQLHINRSYTLHLDQPVIELNDRITNRSDTPAPFMLLYHVNLGFPLVREGSQLIAPYECVMPRDARASAGFETWKYYEKASPGYEEQVFFHHLKAGADGMTEIALINDDIGLSLRFNVEQMPYFTQWKNTRQGIYVSGIEPGNCLPEGQNAARASGRLQMLQPGESVLETLTITILDGKYAMQQARDRIAELDWSGEPAVGCRLSG